MFGSLLTKNTFTLAPDEAEDILALREEFGGVAARGVTNGYYSLRTLKLPKVIYKEGTPSRRFGYKHPPHFFLGVVVPESYEDRLSQVIDLKSRRIRAEDSFLQILANPTPALDSNIIRFECKRVFRDYVVNFISAPIVGEIKTNHGIEGLKLILT